MLHPITFTDFRGVKHLYTFKSAIQVHICATGFRWKTLASWKILLEILTSELSQRKKDISLRKY